MGKYHPHGDMAIYDALVRMAQDFSMRVPLIDGKANFGSVDGDPPAAPRYTEARLDRSALALLEDLDRTRSTSKPNYDEKEEEPVVLPARFRTCSSMARAGSLSAWRPTSRPTISARRSTRCSR